MTIEHFRIALLVKALYEEGDKDLTDEEIQAMAWVTKNRDWLGISSSKANNPRLIRLLNLIEDVYFNRVPDVTEGATIYAQHPLGGQVAKGKVGRLFLY